MRFVQTIWFSTDRFDEMQALMDRWTEEGNRGQAPGLIRTTVAKDLPAASGTAGVTTSSSAARLQVASRSSTVTRLTVSPCRSRSKRVSRRVASAVTVAVPVSSSVAGSYRTSRS